MELGIAEFLLILQAFLRTTGQLIELVSVLENSEIGTSVYDLRERLLQTLSPASLANVTAYAGQQDLFWPFALKNLRIVIARSLDREAICEQQGSQSNRQKQPVLAVNRQNDDECPEYHCCQLLHVNVVVSSTSPTQVYFIRVAVQDLNDNAPIFPRIDTPFDVIPEDTPVGKRIFLPQATDADSQVYGVVQYRISKWIQGNASHFQLGIISEEEEIFSEFDFSKQSNRPFLTVIHPLDRETEEVYEFMLEAIDGGGELSSRPTLNQKAYSGSAIITLRVKDVNDNAPVFDERIYSTVIQENDRPQKVIQFKVYDLDAGENGRVFVNIVDPLNNANNLFRVVLQTSQNQDYKIKYQTTFPVKPQSSFYTGYLHLLDYLDAESLPARLGFFLVATDNGQPQLSSKVEVNVELVNVNDQAPNIVFLQEGKRLTENRLILPEGLTPPGSIVAEVHVTDADSNLAQLTCRITREVDAFNLHEVNALNGESNEQTMLASEFRRHSSSSSSAFLFSYRQFSLRTKHHFDREKRGVYLVSIMCSDNEAVDTLSRNASLHISISDINDETPTFEHPVYTGHVKENDPNGAVRLIQPLRTSDADVGRNALISYSIRNLPDPSSISDFSTNTNGNSSFDATFFRVEPNSGNIWTTLPLDCESKDTYSFLVIATDDGVPEKRSSSALINVIVDDINDNPPEFDQYHFNFEVEENSPSGTVIGKVSIHDADKSEANQRVHYSLRGRTEDLFLIDIDRSSGELSMRRRIDYEKQSSIALTIVAENESPLFQMSSIHQIGQPLSHHVYQTHSAEASLVVSVINVNDNRPEFVPISPHRKHIVFIWEHLPIAPNINLTPKKENTTKTEFVPFPANLSQFVKLNEQRLCEPIPYKVVDKDCDLASQEFCCSLSLENTFDDMFGLIEEVPSVLCALKRPPQPQSFKVTLVARDGTGVNSLSSQIQLSIIIKSGPDLSRYTPSRPISSTPSDESYPAKSSNKKYSVNGEQGVEMSGQVLSEADYFERQKFSSSHSSSSRNADSASSHQMKIISILVSMAGIFCILLLVIIAALKCGVLDGKHFSFAKSSENAESDHRLGDRGVIPQITPKHVTATLQHADHSRMDEYRTLGECFPEEVFYMDQKFSQKRGTGVMCDGTYEISSPFTTITTNNNSSINNNYAGNGSITNELNSRLGTMASPKLHHATSCTKQQPQSVLVATLRPDGSIRTLDHGQPTTYLTGGRIVSPNSFYQHGHQLTGDIQTPTFYSSAGAYQTLDPLTLPKNLTRCVGSTKSQKDCIDPKVTFNLEMIPIGNKESEEEDYNDNVDYKEGRQLEKLLKNNITTPDCEGELDGSIRRTTHLTNLVYDKSTNHSSFV